MRRLLALVLPLTLALGLAACSGGTPKANIATGWEWVVNQQISFDTDQDFDYNTGEVSGSEDVELTLPGEGEVAEDVRESAVASLCEDFIDVEYGKASLVGDILRYAVWGAERTEPSAEYVAAVERIDGQVSDEVGSLEDVDVLVNGERNPEWDRIVDERDARTEELWAAEDADLVDERSRHAEDYRALRASVYTEDGIRQAQELVVDECEIEVPDGYEFPTAADLEIELSEQE